jgi:DNA repair exonuclease SbcCD nuclease subunit
MQKRGKIEFLVFSDAHFYEHSHYSEDNANFSLSGVSSIVSFKNINSRLHDTVKIVNNIIQYALKRNITHIFFCGDFLHSKKSVTKDVFNVTVNLFRQCESYSALEFIMIPGNHDFSSKDGSSHSLQAIKDFNNVRVLESPHDHCFIGNRAERNYTKIIGIPYTEDKEEFITNFNSNNANNLDADYNIILCHTGIQGAKVGSSYVMVKEHDVDTGNLQFNRYTACFFGHYHEHQKVSLNAWIVGAPAEHDWGDRDGTRGFLHVTIDEGAVDVKHIPTPREIPRFKLLNGDSTLDDVKSWDFIRFKTTESITEEHKNNIEGMIAAACGEKPKWLEIIVESQNENKEEFVLSSKATSAETVLDEWVNHSNIEGLPQEKVLQIGKEILSEAQNSLL